MILKAMANLYHPKRAFQTLGGQKVGKEFIKGLISCGISVFSNAGVAKANWKANWQHQIQNYPTFSAENLKIQQFHHP